MAQDQGTYPGLCLLTDADGKVITIEDSVSHDTVVFTHTNTGEGEFAICYPEVLGSGVPEAALANFGTHNVENTATEGYAFTLGDEEYLVRQNVIAPTPGEINDVLYSRSLLVDVSTMDVLVTEDGNVVKFIDGNDDNVCFVKFAGGEWHAETAYYDQIIEASGLDPVSVGCTVTDGVYNIKYGFNTYVLTEDSLTPEVAEWVHPENRLYAILNGEYYYLGNSDGKILLFTSQETEQCITVSESEGSWVFSEMSRGVPPTAESESADEEWSTNDTCTFTVGGVEYTMQIYNYQSSFITPNNIMKF